MLSGGEKSLTTLCFLLSLWDVCSFPIRCLGTLSRHWDPHPLTYTYRLQTNLTCVWTAITGLSESRPWCVSLDGKLHLFIIRKS